METTIAKATSLKCWICGSDATSGEHKTKRTDLRLSFRQPTQDQPLFFHDASGPNKLVRSLDSKILKSPARLCPRCNNALTQPHDQAWEKMSKYFSQRRPVIRPGEIIRANRIFPYDTRRYMLRVHLYFLKLFGCMIVEGNVPIDINVFANSILSEKAHPCVYLEFGAGMPYGGKGFAARSNLEALKNEHDECVLALWLYQLPHVTVNIIFASSNVDWNDLSRAWHPRFGTNRLSVAGFDIKELGSDEGQDQ